MSEHPLDRPIWTSLTTEHAPLAVGDEAVRRYPADIGPLAAMRDGSHECQAALLASVNDAGPVILAEASGLCVPSSARVAWDRNAAQLVHTGQEVPAEHPHRIEALTDEDAEEMLELALLTKPGPFAKRTHALGQFWGVKADGRLVAMAGERMRQEGFAEVSGVCTHPDARGQGLGKALCAHVTRRILDRGEKPYLHAFVDNDSALRLYETLGFRFRSEIRVVAVEAA